ncbi:MAG: chloride channel protein, partial [Selenomonas sp.]
TFVVLGMAGFFAGSIKAPLTASLLIMEITGSFEHLLAVVCVAACAALVNDLTGGRPIYDELYERSRGQGARGSRRRVMAELCVAAGSAMEGRCVSAIDWGAHGHVMNVRRGTVELLPQGSLILKAGDMLYVLTEEGELGALERAAREASGGFSRD